MRHAPFHQIAAVAVVSGILALSACERVVVEPQTTPLAMSMSVSRAAIRSGDSTTIRVTFTNTSNHLVLSPTDNCTIPLEVLKNDQVIAAGSGLCPAALSNNAPVPLRPGETHTVQFVWHGESPSWTVMLGAGQYLLRGFIVVDDSEIRSNSVPVEILP